MHIPEGLSHIQSQMKYFGESFTSMQGIYSEIWTHPQEEGEIVAVLFWFPGAAPWLVLALCSIEKCNDYLVNVVFNKVRLSKLVLLAAGWCMWD